jgi:hypothetical protein
MKTSYAIALPARGREQTERVVTATIDSIFKQPRNRNRHCERSEAIHSFFAALWIASLRSQ